MMNPHLAQLQPYPFEKLALLKNGAHPPSDQSPILLSIGEPKHETPAFIMEELASKLGGLANYPTIAGSLELRQAIADWLSTRFRLPDNLIDPERHVLPVNGTREALFAFAQCIVDPTGGALVLMPNPFYQIYEGAALLAGATPFYVNSAAHTNMLPDFASVPDDVWKRCRLLYVCSPDNPTGSVVSKDTWSFLLEKSKRFAFVIASDECYSEIYPDELAPPIGLLQAAASLRQGDLTNCMVFHSLSKRSSVPGMRSGFVAGDPKIIEKFRLFRTYHGSSMPPPIQAASRKAWRDEAHVKQNRELYRQKFDAVIGILSPVMEVRQPAGSFYLWPQTPVDDTKFARDLYEKYNVTVLPGSYLSRMSDGINPGERRIRIALVPSLEECIDAATRIRQLAQSYR